MNEENSEQSISQGMEDKIKAAVEERVAKELAGVVASMKEAATQGAGSSANVAGGGKSIPVISPERDDELSSDAHLTLWRRHTLRWRLPAGQAKRRE